MLESAQSCRTSYCSFQKLNKKKLSRYCPRSVTGKMARLEGFEPPTNGFGSHYSIRLSYRRVL